MEQKSLKPNRITPEHSMSPTIDATQSGHDRESSIAERSTADAPIKPYSADHQRNPQPRVAGTDSLQVEVEGRPNNTPLTDGGAPPSRQCQSPRAGRPSERPELDSDISSLVKEIRRLNALVHKALNLEGSEVDPEAWKPDTFRYSPAALNQWWRDQAPHEERLYTLYSTFCRPFSGLNNPYMFCDDDFSPKLVIRQGGGAREFLWGPDGDRVGGDDILFFSLSRQWPAIIARGWPPAELPEDVSSWLEFRWTPILQRDSEVNLCQLTYDCDLFPWLAYYQRVCYSSMR